MIQGHFERRSHSRQRNRAFRTRGSIGFGQLRNVNQPYNSGVSPCIGAACHQISDCQLDHLLLSSPIHWQDTAVQQPWASRLIPPTNGRYAEPVAIQPDLERVAGLEIEHGGVGLVHLPVAVALYRGDVSQAAAFLSLAGVCQHHLQVWRSPGASSSPCSPGSGVQRGDDLLERLATAHRLHGCPWFLTRDNGSAFDQLLGRRLRQRWETPLSGALLCLRGWGRSFLLRIDRSFGLWG